MDKNTLLSYVKEHVTGEIAAHGDCQCETSMPCVYCASIQFNEKSAGIVSSIREANAELVKDKERLDWLDKAKQIISARREIGIGL